MIFINCKKCLLCPYVLMPYELMNGLCVACHNLQKEKLTKKEIEQKSLDWFDSLFAEPECKNRT